MITRGPRWIAWLLGTSLVLNVAALFLPFLEMDVVLSGRDVYSLPRSVLLMWDAGLYLIALLVVAFSVCFPFLKLFILQRVWRGGLSRERAEPLMRFVERWGKWSMLDVFIICLLIGLADDQYFVETTPRLGLPCFMAAIVLAMVAGAAVARHAGCAPPALTPAITPAPRRVPLLLAAAVHVTAVAMPFLALDSFWLSEQRLSIAGMVGSLGRSSWSAWLPAVGLAIFLVVAPFAWLVARWAGHTRWCARLQRYAMLDVFVFALAIFLLEGDAFLPTALIGGALALVGAMLLFLVLQSLSGRGLPAGVSDVARQGARDSVVGGGAGGAVEPDVTAEVVESDGPGVGAS